MEGGVQGEIGEPRWGGRNGDTDGEKWRATEKDDGDRNTEGLGGDQRVKEREGSRQREGGRRRDRCNRVIDPE